MTEEDRPYAGKDEDINDKLVLDLAWERQQKKVCSTVQWEGWYGDSAVHNVRTTVVLACHARERANASKAAQLAEHNELPLCNTCRLAQLEPSDFRSSVLRVEVYVIL